MERWLLALETNCTDPAREKEFNHWYDNVHLPDVLATPGYCVPPAMKTATPLKGRGSSWPCTTSKPRTYRR